MARGESSRVFDRSTPLLICETIAALDCFHLDQVMRRCVE